MKLTSPSSVENCQQSKFGSYGTFLFPERDTVGLYCLQTDFLPLLNYMKKRGWDRKSPWQTVGWGTSYIFKREFSGSYEAKRSVQRIFAKIGYPEIEFTKLKLGGFEIVQEAPPIPEYQPPSKKPFKSANWKETPPLSGKNRGRYRRKSQQIGGQR